MRQYRSSWGLVGPDTPWNSLSHFAQSAAKEGFYGIEFPFVHLAFEDENQDSAIALVNESLAETGLDVIPLIASRPAPEKWGDAEAQFEDFMRQLRLAQALGAKKSAAHCGADSFDHATALRFYRDCINAAADIGIDLCLETHRGRPLNDPWKTKRLLDDIPEMRLTYDVSHWHVILDRDPVDAMDEFDEAARRAGHVHARIGHEKGPQVPHPADPLWESHVALYRRWWGIAKQACEARGEVFTITAEFGPPTYMTTRPFTHERDADLVEINMWMRDKLNEWFAQ